MQAPKLIFALLLFFGFSAACVGEDFNEDEIRTFGVAGELVADCAASCSEACLGEVARLSRRILAFQRSCTPNQEAPMEVSSQKGGPEIAVGPRGPFKCTFSGHYSSSNIGEVTLGAFDGNGSTIAAAMQDGCSKCKPYRASGGAGGGWAGARVCKFAACVDANGNIVQNAGNLVPAKCL